MQSKVAFITGASRGIGRAIAEEFARHGYCLAINCKNSGEVSRFRRKFSRVSQKLLPLSIRRNRLQP